MRLYNRGFLESEILQKEFVERSKMVLAMNSKNIAEQQDRPEINAREKIIRIPEEMAKIFPGGKLSMEVPIEGNYCDFMIEVPTSDFLEIFGDNSLTVSQKAKAEQFYLLEIHGAAHYCSVTEELDLKTVAKLELWRKAGYHIGFLTAEELTSAAQLGKESTSEILKILKVRLRWTKKDGPHTFKLEV
jgi:hypothetical protein